VGVTGGTGEAVKTDIPARLDRLPWSRWHWLVIIALGVTWILDGLEVTLVGSIAGALTDKSTLGLTTSQATAAGSFYLAGAVCGALFFGYLTDRFGRRKLFMITLGIYLIFTVATALSWGFWSFMIFRFLAGILEVDDLPTQHIVADSEFLVECIECLNRTFAKDPRNLFRCFR